MKYGSKSRICAESGDFHERIRNRFIQLRGNPIDIYWGIIWRSSENARYTNLLPAVSFSGMMYDSFALLS